MLKFMVLIYPIFGLYFRAVSRVLLFLSLLVLLALYALFVKDMISSGDYLSFNNGIPGFVPTMILFLLPIIPCGLIFCMDYFFWRFMPRHIDEMKKEFGIKSTTP